MIISHDVLPTNSNINCPHSPSPLSALNLYKMINTLQDVNYAIMKSTDDVKFLLEMQILLIIKKKKRLCQTTFYLII